MPRHPSFSGTFVCSTNSNPTGAAFSFEPGTQDSSYTIVVFTPVVGTPVIEGGAGLTTAPTTPIGPNDQVTWDGQSGMVRFKTLNALGYGASYVVGNTYTLNFKPLT